jgi:hypothetical protein
MTDNNSATEVGISPSVLLADHQHTDNDNNHLDYLDDACPPYEDDAALLDDACPVTFGNGPGILAATNGDPMTAEAHLARSVLDNKNDAISPAVQANFAAHDHAMSTAIDDVLVTPQHSSTTPAAATLMSVALMALLEQSLLRNGDVLFASVRAENEKSRAIVKGEYDALLGCLNLALSNIDKHDNKIKQMGTRIETLATNVATDVNTVRKGIKSESPCSAPQWRK